MITAFCVLVVFVMAYRLNRDEGIIVELRERVARLEQGRSTEEEREVGEDG